MRFLSRIKEYVFDWIVFVLMDLFVCYCVFVPSFKLGLLFLAIVINVFVFNDIKRVFLLLIDFKRGAIETTVCLENIYDELPSNYKSIRTYTLKAKGSDSKSEGYYFIEKTDKALVEVGIGNKAKIEYFARSRVIKRIEKANIEDLVMNFYIAEIDYGWIDVVLKYKGVEIYEIGSYVVDNDSPRLLLSVLIDIIALKKEKAFIIWDGEPGVGFWCFERKNNNKVKLYTAFSQEADNFVARDFFRITKGMGGYEDIKKDFPDLEERDVVEDIDIYELSDAVIDGFGKVDIDVYERDWMKYPTEELNELKRLLLRVKNRED